MESDAPDVAPLDKGGLASQIRNENFDEGSGAHLAKIPGLLHTFGDGGPKGFVHRAVMPLEHV
jgi:hypothetical protein